jgi:hypothetical protein
VSTRSKFIYVIAGLLVGCVGFVEFVFWRSNRISPEFLSAAHSAYRSIHECDQISEEGTTFIPCIQKAQDSVALLGPIAKTMHERREYATLHGYLNAVNDCRVWRLSTESPDAKVCHEQLVLVRNATDKLFKNHQDQK